MHDTNRDNELQADTSKADRTHTYLVGSGIATLATAAYLIQETNVPGKNIYILEHADRSDRLYDPDDLLGIDDVVRENRIFSKKIYTHVWDLLSFIPSFDRLYKTVKDELLKLNEIYQKHRLIECGIKVNVSSIAVTSDASKKHKLTPIEIAIISEDFPEHRWINNNFLSSFFKDNFSNICHTKYNHYDDLILPLLKWLKDHNVNFELHNQVTNLEFTISDREKTIDCIHCLCDGIHNGIFLDRDDAVFIASKSTALGMVYVSKCKRI